MLSANNTGILEENKTPRAHSRSRTDDPSIFTISMASKAIKLVHAEKLLVYLEDRDVDI